jgi:hypothetical protein
MSWLITGTEKVTQDLYLYTNTVLLLKGDGTNGSTTILDSSKVAGSPKTITANGNAQISTAQSKFGGSSIAFDGTGDFLTTPNSSAWDFGSSDLTIEAWVYIAANSTPDQDGNRAASICNTWAATTGIIAPTGWTFTIGGTTATTGTSLALDSWSSIANATLYRSTISVPQLTWNHVAATVSSGTRRLFLNGSLIAGTTVTVGSGATAINSIGSNLRVGQTANNAYSIPLNGYIDDLRITKGVARYTANFTPPTAPFPDI